jgi:hypothetical protein
MLGRLISKKDLTLERNTFSEKGYRDVGLVNDHHVNSTNGHSPDLPIVMGFVSTCNVTKFLFPPNISQSTLGGRDGSNACTVIAMLSGRHFVYHKLSNSFPSQQLGHQWCSNVVESIVEGNRIHDFVYAGAPVDIDVEDAAQIFGSDIGLQAFDDTDYFFDMSELCSKITAKQSTNVNTVGIMIANGRSVAIYIDNHGNLAYFNSHKHRWHGALLVFAKKEDTVNFIDYVFQQCKHFFGQPILYGALTWVYYTTA